MRRYLGKQITFWMQFSTVFSSSFDDEYRLTAFDSGCLSGNRPNTLKLLRFRHGTCCLAWNTFRSSSVLRVQVDYQVKVTLMEVYNEQLRDLLAAPSANGDARRLDIRSTAASGLNVPNATQVGQGGGAAQRLQSLPFGWLEQLQNDRA